VTNKAVRSYWEARACGTDDRIVGDVEKYTLEWFDRVEAHRYAAEPFVHSTAQFTRHYGKRVLEVGVGAGTDHLQFARAGADLYGVDLTDLAIETTASRLALYGLSSNLQRLDAESLPFEDGFFDVVFSWGVIHHSARPERIVAEVHRVLQPGGLFIGMMYGRWSVFAYRTWLRHGFPARSVSEVVASHVESEGTKIYTVRQLRRLFAEFEEVTLKTPLELADVDRRWLNFIARLGWFITIRATKGGAQPQRR
jgi:SAM-dependent methyltransferase